MVEIARVCAHKLVRVDQRSAKGARCGKPGKRVSKHGDWFCVEHAKIRTGMMTKYQYEHEKQIRALQGGDVTITVDALANATWDDIFGKTH